MNFAVNSNARIKKLRGPGGNPRSPVISSIIGLRDREVFGICKRNRRSLASNRHLFNVIPRRFAFPLTSLIDDFSLHEDGHVFLGFSSCDRFLISYNVRIEEARHTGFLSHIYTLHWWLWSPDKKARKVGCVRLFANEEIEYSLFLCYAEWPTLKSQIVVYGWRKCCDSCYITIAAVPSLVPCSQCSNLSSSFSEREEELVADLKCEEHGFAMHFKQASGSSQSGILSSSGLKIDGILVLNIGHSIAVLSTGDITKTTDLDNLPLSSIKRRACEDTDTEGDNILDAIEKTLSHDHIPNFVECELETEKLTSKITTQSNSHNFPDSQDMQSQSSIPSEGVCVYDDIDSEHDHNERISLNRRSTVTDKENVLKSPICGQLEYEHSLNVDPYFDPEPKSIVLGRIVKNCVSSLSLSNDGKSPKGVRNQPCSSSGCIFGRCSQKSACDFSDNGAKMCDCAQYHSPMHVSVASAESCVDRKCLSDFRTVIRNKSPFLSPLLNLSVLNERQNALEVTRSDLNFVTPSPTASDGSSSVQYSTDSNVVSNSVKYGSTERNSDGLVSFSENFYGAIRQENISPEEPLPVGETSLHYCSMLCQGAGGEMLHPIEKENASIQAFSQHLVLDLEHVIFDILRTRCYIAYKYSYLVDYEANIMDVCGSTRSVIIHIVALLNVQRHGSKYAPLGNGANAIMQQAEFILSWSLSTGRYEVVVAKPLVSYEERKSGEWKGDWVVKMDSAIKQQCAVRTDPYKSVYILDNSAVLRGRSLSVLWNCDKTLAFTR